MKVLRICLMVSLVANIYLLSQLNKTSQMKNGGEKDLVSTSRSALEKSNLLPLENSENKKQIKTEFLGTDDRSKNSSQEKTELDKRDFPSEEELQQAHEERDQAAKDFLSSSLNFGDQDIDKYFAIEDDLNQELDEFFKNIIEEKGTPHFIFTADLQLKEANIKLKHLDKLKNLLGEEGYRDYKKFRDEYNRKVLESGNSFYIFDL